MLTVEERFWPKVDRRGPDDCWEWRAQRLPHGYGMLRAKRNGRWRYAYAHRIAWELANGPIPAHHVVLHVCDNPPCVNPDHLAIGTQADNVADKVRKNRQHRGMATPTSRLTDAAVVTILTLRGERSATVAARFGVAPRTIRDIWNGKTWVWLHQYANTAVSSSSDPGSSSR